MQVPGSNRWCLLTRLRCYWDGWRLATGAIALTVILPLLVIFSYFMHPEQEIWRHLVDNLLGDLLKNTAVLVAGVVAGTFLLGVSLAWLTGVCEFPGRKIFTWALLLPMAMPTYVLAFVTLGLFDYSGPVQSFLRDLSPSHRIWFPNIRSAGGVIGVMSLALYPYVYLLARSAFKTQGKRAMEAARSLGHTPLAAFFKVALPMARPWIAAGLMLVLMEALADFGAVSIFNYDTFTTAIYKAWFGFFSLSAAAQLSALLVIIVLAVIVVEQNMRAKMRFGQSGRMSLETGKIKLTGWSRWMAAGFALVVVLIAFIIPFGQLLVWSAQIFSEEFTIGYLGHLSRSLLFAVIATGVIGGCALLLAYTQRRHADKTTGWLVRISTLGYALPGTVLAVGIFIVISFVDNLLIDLLRIVAGYDAGPLIQGTIFIVIAAYMVRFMAAGFSAISSAMHRLTPNLDEAAISMGVTGVSLLRRVHVPILKSGILTASMLVFVDVMKEMPITLMTRPFGWDTLAVKIFELTSEGEWERAALPAVALVLGGLLPVIFLSRQGEDHAVIKRGAVNRKLRWKPF
jgi:iron(III) transport system permease protein